MGEITVADRLDRLPMTRFSKTICAVMFIGWFAEAIDIGGTSFLMPVILQEFNLTPIEGGYFSSAVFVGMLVGALIGGSLGNRLGRKKPIMICMIIEGFACFGLCFSGSYTELLMWRFVLGLSLGAQLPCAMSYLSESIPTKSRAKYMASYQLFLPLGMACAGVITMLVLPTFGWRGVYFVEALPVLAVFLVWKFCPESALWLESVGRHKEAAEIATKFEDSAAKELKGKPLPEIIVRKREEGAQLSIKSLFTRRYLPVVAVTFGYYFFAMFSDYGLATFLTTLLVEKGINVLDSTALVTLGVCGGIPAFFFSAWIVEKKGRRAGFLFASIFACVFAILYGSMMSFAALIVAGILYQFGKYSLAMMTAVYTPELFDTRIRSSGVGLATSFGRLGSIFGSIILGWVFAVFGIEVTFFVAAVAAIIPGIIVFAFGPETKGKSL